jgi:NADH-quinone oxidoreductase subunit E
MGLSAPTGSGRPWAAWALERAGAPMSSFRCPSRRSPAAKKTEAPATPRAVDGEIRRHRTPLHAPKAKTRTKGRCSAVSPCPAPEPEELGPSPHLLDAPRGGKADDLTVLKGVGAKLATSLNEFGIYHFDQLATLDEEGIDWLNEQQNGFKMLCARYGVVEQARARLA